MEEKYLQDLYNWISGVDESYRDEVSFADFATNMQDDPQYAAEMYNWIGSFDETFTAEVPLGEFMQKVSAPPQTRPKKKNPLVSEVA